nr:uncharacterized protein LOC116765352 [Danaus plexippus plexippus]
MNERSSNAVYGINKFSDLSKEEFVKYYTGLKREESPSNEDHKKTDLPESFNVTAPDQFDWRKKGVVSSIKNQKHCGSCWAFSAAANVESIHAIKTGKLIDVSEQQLLDCDKYDSGCSGGLPWDALRYFVANGAMSLKSYPYVAKEGKCRYDSSKVEIRLKEYKHKEKLSEDQIKEHLYNIGPLSIAITSSPLASYNGGILIEECHRSYLINHAVLLVGYGKENGVKYWIVKNSWGQNWGENGYFRMKMGVNCLLRVRSKVTEQQPVDYDIWDEGCSGGMQWLAIRELGQRRLYSLEEAPTLFEQFIKDYNKEYDESEKEERFKIFVNNLKDINAMNERSSNAVYGINKFSDLSKEEFIKYYTGLKRDRCTTTEHHKSTDLPKSFNITAPDQFDWRKKGVVSSVKNQRHCGSCWAFSAAANVESIHAIKTGKLIDVSEQQLLDCDKYDSGCSGGLEWIAMRELGQRRLYSLEEAPTLYEQIIKDYKKEYDVTEKEERFKIYSRELGQRRLYSLEEAPTLFEQFIKDYNKEYDESEKEERFKIFVNNLKDINAMNERSSNAVYGINKFSDLSKEEFIKYYTGLKREESPSNEDHKKTDLPESFNVTAPDQFDWRKKGVVSSIKNQKHCGSCWAFSAAGNVESIHAIKTGKLVHVSEQQLVDCDSQDSGCSGGLTWNAMRYFRTNGAVSLKSYPYVAQNENCRYDSNKVVIRLKDYKHITQLSEDQIKEHLYNIGLLSIDITSTQLTWYEGGILIEECRRSDLVDHAVLLVEYGKENSVEYWIVKNSWGQNGGEKVALQYNVYSRELGQKHLYSLEEAPTLFEQFIKDYNKEYDESEKEERFKIFVNNLKDINAMNERSSNAVYGINKFSDLSKDEFVKFYTGLKREESPSNEDHKKTDLPKSFNVTAPDQFDWRKKGVVSSVKFQGHCVSCWAFSVAGNVESINAIKTGKLIDVSEQQLVDCDEWNFGCSGGIACSKSHFSYFHKKGAMSLESYPYVGKEGQCRYNSSKVVIRLKDYQYFIALSEDEIKEYLYNIGPLSIDIDSSQIHHYKGGIVIKECQEVKKTNHAVLLVGYGKENGVEYWIVKNSWGQNWGEKGYFRIQRGVNCLLLAKDGITTAVI